MNNYCLSDGKKIINCVVSKSKDFIEKNFQDFDIIEPVDGKPWVGWTLWEDGWRPPKPYESWVWLNNDWVAPVEQPLDSGFVYVWNEELVQWDSIPVPQVD